MPFLFHYERISIKTALPINAFFFKDWVDNLTTGQFLKCRDYRNVMSYGNMALCLSRASGCLIVRLDTFIRNKSVNWYDRVQCLVLKLYEAFLQTNASTVNLNHILICYVYYIKANLVESLEPFDKLYDVVLMSLHHVLFQNRKPKDLVILCQKEMLCSTEVYLSVIFCQADLLWPHVHWPPPKTMGFL